MTLTTKVLSVLLIPYFLLAPSAVAQAPSAAAYHASHVSLIADAIVSVEGKCGTGQSGEEGCFQYRPSTWRAYSMDVAGKVLPQESGNERMVTEGMIRKWVDQGTSDRGIFLLWNQGSATGWGGGTDCYEGVNDHGVAYDSCDYAKRGLEYLAAHKE